MPTRPALRGKRTRTPAGISKISPSGYRRRGAGGVDGPHTHTSPFAAPRRVTALRPKEPASRDDCLRRHAAAAVDLRAPRRGAPVLARFSQAPNGAIDECDSECPGIGVTAKPRQQPSRPARRTTGSPRLSGSHAARGRGHPPRYCFPDAIGRTPQAKKPEAIVPPRSCA